MSGYYLLKNGEFAYNKSYSVGYDFGSIKRLDMYDEGALSTLYICFALKKHNSDFIKTYFDSLKWYKEIYMIAAEGARNHGLLNVPTEDFFDTVHILPKSIDEQTKIADFLTLLEQRISKQEQLVNALKLYKRGVHQQIFSNNHKCKSLKEITSYVSSSLTLSSLKDEPLGPYPVYDASGISQYIDSFQIGNKYIAIIKDGSGVGKLQLCKSQSSIIGTLGAIVSKELPIEYIYAFMQIIDFKQFVTGMAIPHIYYKDYSEIKVPIPDVATINKIVNIFNGIDLTIIAEENKYNYMMELKQGLLQKMFI